MRICKICGGEYPEEEMIDSICINCSGSIIHTDEIPPGVDDFL